MKRDDIKEMLEIICQYNNVKITQTFTKENEDVITVQCVPNTPKLEVAYLQTGKVEYYESKQDALEVIYRVISSPGNL